MQQPEISGQAIYTTLREEILSLAIKPGQQISESEICDRFGVSRTPVRTAFSRLRDAGLLHIVPYKGTTVTLLDLDQINQLIYMRVAMETAVLRDLIASPDPLAIQQIRHNLSRQKQLLEHPPVSVDAFYEADSRLHRIWFARTHKELLWKLIQKAQVNYTRFRMLDIVAVHSFAEIYREHLEIFDLIQQGDFSALEPVIKHHLHGGINRLGGQIDTDFADYFVKAEDAFEDHDP